jgi:hypothetical protein
MRLIDADTLKDMLFGYAPPEMTWDRGDIEHKIDEMPTVEPKWGRWILQKDPYEFFDAIPVCSNCGTTTKYREKYPYCPWCGAAMTEGGETDD